MADFDTFMKSNGLTGASLWASGDENDSGEITFDEDDHSATEADENTFTVEEEDEEDGDFIPDSLRAFLRDAQVTLQNEQLSLQAHLMETPTKSNSSSNQGSSGSGLDAVTPFLDPTTPQTPQMMEDSEDILLKQQLLGGLSERDSMLFGSPSGSGANTLDLDQNSFATAGEDPMLVVSEGFVDAASGTLDEATTEKVTPAMMTDVSPMASPIVSFTQKGVDVAGVVGSPPEMKRTTGGLGSQQGSVKKSSPPPIVVPKQRIPPLKPISPRISPKPSTVERPRMVTESPVQADKKKPSTIKSVLRSKQEADVSSSSGGPVRRVVVTSPAKEAETPSHTKIMQRRNTPAPKSMEYKVTFETSEATPSKTALNTPLPDDSDPHRMPRRNTPAPKTLQSPHVQFDDEKVPVTPSTTEHRHMPRRNTPAPETFAVPVASVTFDQDLTTPSVDHAKIQRRNTPAPESMQMHVGFEESVVSPSTESRRSMPRRNTPAPKNFASAEATEMHVTIGETPKPEHLSGEETKMPRRSTPAPRTLQYEENKVVIQTPVEALKTPTDHKRLHRRATPAPKSLQLSAEKMGTAKDMPSPISTVPSPGVSMTVEEPIDETREQVLSPNITPRTPARQKSFWDRLSTPRSSKSQQSNDDENNKPTTESADKKTSSSRMSFSRANKRVSPMPTSSKSASGTAPASRSIDAAKKARERVLQRKREEAAEQARQSKERLEQQAKQRKSKLKTPVRSSSLRQGNPSVAVAQERAKERVQQRQQVSRSTPTQQKTSSRGSNVSVERAQAVARQRVMEQKKKKSPPSSSSTKKASTAGLTPPSKPPPLDLSSPSFAGQTASTRRKSISAEEGQKLARERVRQRQLASSSKSGVTTSSSSSRISRRSSTLPKPPKTFPKSPALATKSSLGTKKYSTTGKPETRNSLDPNPITRAFGSPTHGFQAGPGLAPGGKPKLTVPKGPNLSTTARHGNKPPPAVAEKKVEPQLNLHEKPKLTVPKAPKLSMSARLGEKPVPNAATKKDEPIAPPPPPKRPSGLTVPKAPRLSTSVKYGKKATPSVRDAKKAKVKVPKFEERPKTTVPVPFNLSRTKSMSVGSPARGGKSDCSLAERMIDYQKHIREESPASATRAKPKLTKPVPFNLSKSNAPLVPSSSKPADSSCLAESVLNYQMHMRDAPPLPPVKRDMKPTVPRAPKFAAHPKRELPKSSEEKEKEMMEYYKAHPFKASRVPKATTSAPRRPRVEKKPLTTPVAPRVSGLERKSSSRSKPKDDTEENAEKKKFQARPMPNLSYRGPPATKKTSQKPTQPKPFQLSSERKGSKAKSKPVEEIEVTKQFKARPLPLSTFVPPEAPPPRQSLPATSADRPPYREPKLQSAAQAEKRLAMKEAHEKHAEMVLQQKKESVDRLKTQRQEAEIPKAKSTPFTPTTPEPFNLQSEARHEASRQRMEEEKEMKLKEEEEARRFVAQPMKMSPSQPRKIRTPHKITEPKPFVLSTDQRLSQKQLQQEEQEEKSEIRLPKARPVPKGVYEYKPLTPVPKKKLVEPSSPRLESESRAKARQDFDAKVEAERQAELARKLELEARQKREEEEELMEKRRLPVSEGGMMHVPLPIMGRPGAKAMSGDDDLP